MHTSLSLLTHPAPVITAHLEVKPDTRLSPPLLGRLQGPEVPRLVATVPPYKGRGRARASLTELLSHRPPGSVLWSSTGSFTFHSH